MPNEPKPAEEKKQRVEVQLQGLKPVRLEGAPKVSAKWSGAITNLKAEKQLGRGSFGEVWAISRLDMPLKEIPDSSTSGLNALDVSLSKLSDGRIQGPGSRREKHAPHAVFAAKMLRNVDTNKNGKEQSRGPASHASKKGTTIGGEHTLTTDDLDTAKDEASLVMSLRHPHVVKCYGAFQNENFLVFFYEYGRGGDVDRRLSESGKLTREEALSITWQIHSAVKYLHKNGIVHGDIKPRNIFYKYDRKWFEDNERDKSKSHEVESRDKYLVFLGDFGLAFNTTIEDGNPTGRCGTLDYMAPEVLRAWYYMEYDAKVDLWSLGITTYKLMTNTKPHFDQQTIDSIGSTIFKKPKGKDDDDSSATYNLMYALLANYLEKHIQDIVKERFHNDADVRAFLQGCLTIDPEKRIADGHILARARSRGGDYETTMGTSSPQSANDKRKGIREDFNARRKWKAPINVNRATGALQKGPEKNLEKMVSKISIQDTSTRPEDKIKSKKAPDKKDVKLNRHN